MRPIDISPKNANQLWNKLYSVKNEISAQPRYKINDAVRIALEKPVFRKGYFPTFTDEIFRIDKVIKGPRTPVHYYIRDYKGDRIKGRFYAQDFAKTREDAETTYRIEKVLRKRRNKKGEMELQVRFVGYPNETYWISESDLVS
jgi:hypothetical protein